MDGHFGWGDNEKGLIITTRYWGLEFSASEVLAIGITGNQTVRLLGEVFLFGIRRRSI
jgi:hypothetical protein